MYVDILFLFTRPCVGIRICVFVCVLCAYPIILESHLRETSVACHLQRMRVAHIKEEDQ